MTTKDILIIDDDAGQHIILESQLKLGGYRVLHAYSGQEALELVASNHVDLIILDVNMPGMDGFQTLDRLRKEQGNADIPIIFLSSLDRQYLKVKGLEGGADDYLTKPFDSAELTARIKAVLRRSSKAPKQEPGTMQGHIQSVGLAELLQSMSLSAKTCTIIFPEMAGEIAIRKGAIVAMRQAACSGKEALVRLLLIQRGSFLVTYDQVADLDAEEPMSIEYLLLYGVSQADEIREKIEEFGAEDMHIALVAPQQASPEIQDLASDFPLSLLALLVKMAGNPKDNVETIRSALAQGILEYAPAQ